MASNEPITEENTDIPEFIDYMFSLIGSKRKTYRYHKQPIVKRDMIFINLDDNAYIQKYEEPALAGYTSLNFVENVLYTLKTKYILKFMNLEQSIRFIRIIKSYVFNSIFTNILFISTFDIKKSINDDVVYNKYMKKLKQLIELLIQKHNITEEDILNDAPNYSSKKLKIVTIEKSASKPETKRRSVAKNETKTIEKPINKSRSVTKPLEKPAKKSRSVTKPLTKPKEEKKSKKPSNNKTKVHNRINNNLETRLKFIREKLAKAPQKSILKKEGTAI